MNFEKNMSLYKKYNTELVHDYTEYPTKSNWKESVDSKEYQSMIKDWFNRNEKDKVLFYVHTPFCEQLCYFCLCSKEITRDYSVVENYLYNYLFKEIDLIEEYLNQQNIKLNVKEIYFGGGSPTYYKEKEFSALIKKLKNIIDFDELHDFTVEIDPRRVDEEKLLSYSKYGVNRISFGIQDFDIDVQKEINRIQPPEIVEKILTKKVRDTYRVINFDLLIGLPKQNLESIENTINSVVHLSPTQIQTMYVHYKPNTRKYMVRMVRNSPMLDFFDRKNVFLKASEMLLGSGYNRAGFESYALSEDPLDKAMTNNEATYNSLGTQRGDCNTFFAVGSSAHGSFGNDYYVQNYYEQNIYRKTLDENQLPIYRGLKLNDDDKARRSIIKDLRTYFKIDFSNYEFEFTSKFKNEFFILKKLEDDGIVTISENQFSLTKLGEHLAPQVSNVFDIYNRYDFYNKIIS